MIELTAPPEPRDLLRGRVAVVTAAAGTGIGFATARRFALEGASVMISDRHEIRLVAALESLRAEVTTPVAAMPCDVTDGDQIERLYDATEAQLGPIDVAFNNAGLGGRSALVDMTDEVWTHVLDVTLYSAFRCTRSLLRRMIPRRTGTIINIASVTAWRAEAEQSHYAAAKAAVAALSRCAAGIGWSARSSISLRALSISHASIGSSLTFARTVVASIEPDTAAAPGAGSLASSTGG